MSRFHQRLREDLKDVDFAAAFYDMSVDIALLQVLEQARRPSMSVRKNLLSGWGGGTTSHRDTLVPRCSSKPYIGHHLRYTSCVRA